MNNKIVELANKDLLPELIYCPKHLRAYTEIHGDNGDTRLLLWCEQGHYFHYDVLSTKSEAIA